MQTHVTVRDTDQEQGNVMYITPNHDNEVLSKVL